MCGGDETTDTDAGGEAKMKKLGEAFVLEDHLIQELIKVARKNWDDWHDVFQHGGPVADNPVLADERRFARFRREYGVNRIIWAGRHDKFRLGLCTSSDFSRAIQDDTGHALDRLERHLRSHFGTKRGKNLKSDCSKASGPDSGRHRPSGRCP